MLVQQSQTFPMVSKSAYQQAPQPQQQQYQCAPEQFRLYQARTSAQPQMPGPEGFDHEDSDPNDRSFQPNFSVYIIKAYPPQLEVVYSNQQAAMVTPFISTQTRPQLSMPPPREEVLMLKTKDQLWKIMMRAFRRFIKKESLSSQTVEQVKKLPAIRQGEALVRELCLPEEIQRSQKYQCALLLLFFSYRYCRHRQITSPVKSLMTPYLHEILPKFLLVFNENKQLHRRQFFADPLIQCLWTRFREAKPQLIMQTFSERGTQYFYNHVLLMEASTGFQILPTSSFVNSSRMGD